MRKSHVMGTVAMVLALGFTPIVRAQAPPSGVYTNSFNGVLALWDVSGTYPEDMLGGNLDGSYTVSVDAKGKITGDGNASYYDDVDDISVDMDFTVNGAVKAIPTGTQVLMNQAFKGTGSYGGTTFTFSGKFKYDLGIDASTSMLSGNVTGKICASGQGCVTLTEANGGEPIYVETQIADVDMDGSWNLVLDVQNINGKSLMVTATVVLSNSRTVNMTGKGKYSVKTDLSKLTLKGNGLDTGSALSLVGNSASLEVIALKGKLLGQKPVLAP